MKSFLKLFFSLGLLMTLVACDEVDSDIVANYGKEITTPEDTTGGADTTEI